LKTKENRKRIFLFLHGFWVETKLGMRTQSSLYDTGSWPAASGYDTNHGKVFTVHTQGAR
jgi:hypothetical protein